MLKTPAPLTEKPKLAGSEKVTINLGFVDLGQIDLMVAERFYSNRTDFIRAAIRNPALLELDPTQAPKARQRGAGLDRPPGPNVGAGTRQYACANAQTTLACVRTITPLRLARAVGVPGARLAYR